MKSVGLVFAFLVVAGLIIAPLSFVIAAEQVAPTDRPGTMPTVGPGWQTPGTPKAYDQVISGGITVDKQVQDVISGGITVDKQVQGVIFGGITVDKQVQDVVSGGIVITDRIYNQVVSGGIVPSTDN